MLLEDKLWNKIYDKKNMMYLFLKKRWETRRLCTLKDWNIYVNKKKSHIFRSLDAYWFNYVLLKSIDPTWSVFVYEEDWNELSTTIQNILQNWKILNFWTEWFEAQVFLSRNKFV